MLSQRAINTEYYRNVVFYDNTNSWLMLNNTEKYFVGCKLKCHTFLVARRNLLLQILPNV